MAIRSLFKFVWFPLFFLMFFAAQPSFAAKGGIRRPSVAETTTTTADTPVQGSALDSDGVMAGVRVGSRGQSNEDDQQAVEPTRSDSVLPETDCPLSPTNHNADSSRTNEASDSLDACLYGLPD